MIPPELEAQILRLYTTEHWPVGTIARQLSVHHTTVRRVVTRAGLPAPTRERRPSLIDPYLPFVKETLERAFQARLKAILEKAGHGEELAVAEEAH